MKMEKRILLAGLFVAGLALGLGRSATRVSGDPRGTPRTGCRREKTRLDCDAWRAARGVPARSLLAPAVTKAAEQTSAWRIVIGGGENSPCTAISKHRPAQASPAAAPLWAVEFGKEFWRRPTGAGTVKPGRSPVELPATINADDVIERVSHAWTTEPTGAVAQVKART
jgi:hypothetical protein